MKLKFCCDICYQWFPTVSDQEHHRSQHGDASFTSEPLDNLPELPDNTRNINSLEHITITEDLVHARSHLPAELKNRYQCDQCPKRFGTKPNLMAHKRIHTGVRDYTCDQCGKSFVQKGNLDNHLLTHTAARPFNCNICGKAFKTLVRLRKHGSVHSGLKPHQCDVCGRQFRERGTLKEHHRIHTGAMPFTCEFCGKCFRPYSCNECQHHFTNWPNYNKHMKRRHGINTSVTCRTRQDIPPTGMPHRNPPGTVLAPPQPLGCNSKLNKNLDMIFHSFPKSGDSVVQVENMNTRPRRVRDPQRYSSSSILHPRPFFLARPAPAYSLGYSALTAALPFPHDFRFSRIKQNN
ncbi:hypothetical protein NQ318_014954 [Aromia moschata]|uniref:C2H2-type domain-containing protein n=1 Tax=Aromia moschata TaxID=1265417 RepID=A0AAV8X5X6_9CUCU|nr:hypothetical protein NQ318_014954 [Aromia moschata]